MLGIVIYHTNLKINNQDCTFLRTSQFPIAIYIRQATHVSYDTLRLSQMHDS